MPGSCKHCNKQLARVDLNRHENEECEERPVLCRFSKIGCPWRGMKMNLNIIIKNFKRTKIILLISFLRSIS